jgi:hypothetical protein
VAVSALAGRPVPPHCIENPGQLAGQRSDPDLVPRRSATRCAHRRSGSASSRRERKIYHAASTKSQRARLLPAADEGTRDRVHCPRRRGGRRHRSNFATSSWEGAMKSIRRGSWIALCVTILAGLPAAAAEKAVNLAVFTPLSLVKAEDSVTAFRFNLIYGKNSSVGVVDLGFVNHTTTLSNGLQWGFVNYTEGTMSGLQIAAVNINTGTTRGLQWAGFNYAENAGGLQLAFVNYARRLDGVQIGVLNIIKEGGFLPVCVIANWSKR